MGSKLEGTRVLTVGSWGMGENSKAEVVSEKDEVR